jgi:DNA repair exonuclease SbcCD ATPase subunit
MPKATEAPNAAPQPIEELQKRYERLNTRKIQADTNLENATKQFEALKEELRKSYGTDDIAALREKLDAMRAENEAKRKNYQAELDAIDSALAAIEQKVAATESGQSNGAESK